MFADDIPVPFEIIASSSDYFVSFLCTECGLYSKEGAGRKFYLEGKAFDLFISLNLILSLRKRLHSYQPARV